MTSRRTLAFAFVSSCVMLAFAPAYAGIGGIGSPVRPSNLPPAPRHQLPQDQPASEDTTFSTQDRTPLVVIRFNQYHVDFARVLRQAVEATSETRPGATYEIVSLVPVAGTRAQGDQIGAAAAANLNSVVQQLRSLGVPPSQIRTSTQSSPTQAYQEVDIYVN